MNTMIVMSIIVVMVYCDCYYHYGSIIIMLIISGIVSSNFTITRIMIIITDVTTIVFAILRYLLSLLLEYEILLL